MDNRLDVYLAKVSEFRAAFDFSTPRFFEDSDSTNSQVQARLIMEEWQEYEQANSRIGVIDALGDLLYVTIGAILATGIRIWGPSFPPPIHTGQPYVKIGLANQVSHAVMECNKYQLCKRGLIRTLSDLYYRIEHAAIASGIDLPRAFDIIHDSNMGKLWSLGEIEAIRDDPAYIGFTIKYKTRNNIAVCLVKNKEGKLVKPPSFQPPDLSKL